MWAERGKCRAGPEAFDSNRDLTIEKGGGGGKRL